MKHRVTLYAHPKTLAWATFASLSFSALASAQTPEAPTNAEAPTSPREAQATPPAAETPAEQAPSAPTPAPAAPAQSSASGKKPEVIQVTGSRLKQIDLESAGSMTTFDRKAIEESGYGNVADFLRNSLPAANLTSENATLSQTAGVATFEGRDFGAGYTLVLLNGRRLPASAIADDAVDLNLIPTAAVERVDYLTDGASAIYGSDAIAGVLNIITRKNFEGSSIATRMGRSSRGDATEVSLQIVSGASSDRGNFLIAGDTWKRESVEARDRPLAKSAIAPDGTDGRSPIGLPGFIVRGDATNTVVPFDSCPEEQKANGNCRFDFAPYYQAVPKSERQSVYTVFDYQILPQINFYGEARFSRTFTKTINAAAPGAITLRGDSPNNPYPGETIEVYRRYLDFGPRSADNANESLSTVAGLKGPISDNHNWSFEVARHHLRNLQVGTEGNVNRDAAEEAFNAGTFNPFIFNTVENEAQFDAFNQISTATFREGVGRLQTYALNFDGTLPFELSGGNIGYAAGAEYRQEHFRDRSDNLSKGDKILGGASSDGSGSRENEAVYGELALPVLKELDLTLALRHDRIANKDEKSTYKVAALYSPIERLKLRATYGTGFKAPQMHELYLGKSFGAQDAIDPQTCGNDDPCQLNAQSVGNTELKPEESVAYNLGVVGQVTDTISLRADYWDIKIKNKVDSVTPQAVLNNPGSFPADFIKRGPGGRLNVDGAYVRTQLQNLSEANSAGVELGATYANNTSLGRVTSAILLNKLVKSKGQQSSDDPLCDVSGDIKGPDGTFSLDWNNAVFGAGGSIRHLSAIDSYSGGFVAGTCTRLKPESKLTVNSHDELDLRASYISPWATEFGLGVLNATDAEPEFDRNESWPWYDQAKYSNIGRYFYVSASHQFQ